MNIEELYNLSKWIITEFKKLDAQYNNVVSVLQNNSTQQNKQPLEEPLMVLRDSLSKMPMNELTMDQTRLLDDYGVLEYLGKHGVLFLSKIEHQTGLDPATALKKVQSAKQSLDKALERANQIHSSFSGLEIEALEPAHLDDDRCLVRVEFQQDASIHNVVEWEKWSKKWVAISRGIAISVGEAPESVLVVGASRGSIIIDLAVTASFAKVFTGIVNMVVKSAMGIIELENMREDLRHKKYLNKKTEEGMNEQIAIHKKAAVAEITEKAKELAAPKTLDGDEDAKLQSAIKTLIEFHKKGGGLDFVPPEIEHLDDEDENNDEEDNQAYAARIALQDDIKELRGNQERFKQLTSDLDQANDDEDDD